MNDKRNREFRMHRISGMSSERVAEMHKNAEEHPWRVRCWNCRTWNEGLRSSLITCRRCDKHLWSRD